MALVGKVVVAQGGGPTAVINASIAGVIQEARQQACILGIYGGLNGILGILKEELVDLSIQSQREIDLLATTPAAAPMASGGMEALRRWFL